MTERTSNVAEVVVLDKHKRLAYNTKVVDALVRVGLWRMNPHEFMVLMYLLTHTIFVGKDRITLPLRVMLEGAEAGGNWLQVPIPMSKRTLLKSIQGLKSAGFIETVRNRVVPGYGMLKAASTIVVCRDGIDRLMAEAEATRGTCIPYNDEGVTPVVSTPEQSH